MLSIHIGGRRHNQSNGANKVSRHIILVRHGQCDLSDAREILTPLGRAQALMTGKHLKSMNYPIAEAITSSLERAKETGEIILECLPQGIARSEDELLNEGAPIKPDPVEYWDFEPKVRQ